MNRHVVVAGLGVAGFASADGLLDVGARVTVLDEADTPELRDKARVLETLGATVCLGPGSADELPAGAQVLVASPSWTPGAPVFAQATARGVPIWSDLDAAWQVAQERTAQAAWVLLAGPDAASAGRALASILAEAALSAALVGRSRPVMEAVLDEVAYDVLVVEASAAQLHWTGTVSPHAAAIVGPVSGADLGRVYHGVRQACVYDVATPAAEQLVADADVVEGARAIGFTAGVPAPSMVGVVDGLIVDRAFIAQRRDSAMELAQVAGIPEADLPAALAAAALARSLGVRPQAVRAGLRTRHAADLPGLAGRAGDDDHMPG